MQAPTAKLAVRSLILASFVLVGSLVLADETIIATLIISALSLAAGVVAYELAGSRRQRQGSA